MLLSFSWADNFVRIGTLVLLVHDAVDFWMEVLILKHVLIYNKTTSYSVFIIFFNLGQIYFKFCTDFYKQELCLRYFFTSSLFF